MWTHGKAKVPAAISQEQPHKTYNSKKSHDHDKLSLVMEWQLVICSNMGTSWSCFAADVVFELLVAGGLPNYIDTFFFRQNNCIIITQYVCIILPLFRVLLLGTFFLALPIPCAFACSACAFGCACSVLPIAFEFADSATESWSWVLTLAQLELKRPSIFSLQQFVFALNSNFKRCSTSRNSSRRFWREI